MSGFQTYTIEQIYAEAGIKPRDIEEIATQMGFSSPFSGKQKRTIIDFAAQAKTNKLTIQQFIEALKPQPVETCPNPPDGHVETGSDQLAIRNSLKSQAIYATLENIEAITSTAFDEIRPHIPEIIGQVVTRKLVEVMPANFSTASHLQPGEDPDEVLKKALLGYGIGHEPLRLKSAQPHQGE